MSVRVWADGQLSNELPSSRDAGVKLNMHAKQMTESPPWADTQLSSEIVDIQIAGEGQHIEFKRELDTDDVRREIAAFATSGGGRLYVGIDDEGNLHGLAIDDVKARDELAHRLDGIGRSVKPTVKFAIAFGVTEQQVIACVTVDNQQDHPVFYSNQKPYIRDGRTSRPAEPEEVQKHVWAHPSSEFRRKSEEQILKLRDASEKRSRDADALALDSQSRFLDRVYGPRNST